MSKGIKAIKSFKVAASDARPVSNKFVYTINAGMASARPPLGPLLGKYGINIANFCKEFNKKTSEYIQGIPIPCVVTVNPDRSFKLDLRQPHFEYFLKQAAGINSFFRIQGVSGVVTVKHIYEIAKIKHEDPYSYVQLEELQDVVKKYLLKAHRYGIKIVKEIDPVKYEQFLKEREELITKYNEELKEEREAKFLRT